ncbi:MAG: guanylate kinase [Verrucomicrobiota bacterium]
MDSGITQPGLLFIVSGPAGSGKTTLCDRMLAEEPAIQRVVTSTSRPPREGEQDRADYYFFDKATFERKIEAGDFYEHALVHSNHYGVLRSEVRDKLAAGSDLLLNVDVQGAATFCEAGKTDPDLKGRVVSIFIMPPDLEELEKRLRGRGTDDEAEIQRRMRVALDEIRHCDRYDYCLRSASRAQDFENLQAIYRAEKMRVRR